MHFSIVSILLALTMSTAQPNRKSVIENRKRLLSTQSPPQPIPVLIDSIRQHYLALEIDLWNLIDSVSDTAYVLSQIHGIHLNFFDQSFGEVNVTFDDYAFDRQTQLLNIVASINRTVSMVVKNSLRENSLSFHEKAAMDTNRYQIDLTNEMDMLFNLTTTEDFYDTIERVSV